MERINLIRSILEMDGFSRKDLPNQNLIAFAKNKYIVLSELGKTVLGITTDVKLPFYFTEKIPDATRYEHIDREFYEYMFAEDLERIRQVEATRKERERMDCIFNELKEELKNPIYVDFTFADVIKCVNNLDGKTMEDLPKELTMVLPFGIIYFGPKAYEYGACELGYCDEVKSLTFPVFVMESYRDSDEVIPGDLGFFKHHYFTKNLDAGRYKYNHLTAEPN